MSTLNPGDKVKVIKSNNLPIGTILTIERNNIHVGEGYVTTDGWYVGTLPCAAIQVEFFGSPSFVWTPPKDAFIYHPALVKPDDTQLSYDEAYPMAPTYDPEQPIQAKHKCYCDIVVVLQQGCQCGGE